MITDDDALRISAVRSIALEPGALQRNSPPPPPDLSLTAATTGAAKRASRVTLYSPRAEHADGGDGDDSSSDKADQPTSMPPTVTGSSSLPSGFGQHSVSMGLSFEAAETSAAPSSSDAFPASQPVVAFAPTETVAAKFTLLLSCLSISVNEEDDVGRESSLRSLLQAYRGVVADMFPAIYSSQLHSSASGRELSRSMGNMLPEGSVGSACATDLGATATFSSSHSLRTDEKGSSFSLQTTVGGIDSIHLDTLLSTHGGFAGIIEHIARECIADVPRLMQTAVNSSPHTLRERKKLQSVFARKAPRKSIVNAKLGPTEGMTADDPIVAAMSRSQTGNTIVTFFVASQLLTAFLSLLEEELIEITCMPEKGGGGGGGSSNDLQARLDIAAENMIQHWKVVRSTLAGEAASITTVPGYRGSKGMSQAQKRAMGSSTTPSPEDLLRLTHEWCRIAAAGHVMSKQGTLKKGTPTTTLPTMSVPPTRRIFRIRFSPIFGIVAQASDIPAVPEGTTGSSRKDSTSSTETTASDVLMARKHSGAVGSQQQLNTSSDSSTCSGSLATVVMIGKSQAPWQRIAFLSPFAPEAFGTRTFFGSSTQSVQVVAGLVTFACLVYCGVIAFASSWGVLPTGLYIACAPIVAIAAVAAIVSWNLFRIDQQRHRARVILNVTQSIVTAQLLSSSSSQGGSGMPSPQHHPPQHLSINETGGGLVDPSSSLANTVGSMLGNMPALLVGNAADESSVIRKTPNPLNISLFTACGGTMPTEDNSEEDEKGVFRVRLDPSGTFLIPFVENEPILLDGAHVHHHLALFGIEFADDAEIGGGGSPSSLVHDGAAGDYSDEDRYVICMWNHAMTVLTGGYTNDMILDQTLSQIAADVHSYTTIVDQIRSIEKAVEDGLPLPTNTLRVNVVNKEKGSCVMQMTLSPVTQRTDEALTVDGESIIKCVGVLIIGVPVDPATTASAMFFRNKFLSEVLDHFLSSKFGVGPDATASAFVHSANVTPRNSKVSPKDESAAFGSSLGQNPLFTTVSGASKSSERLRSVNRFGIINLSERLATYQVINDSAWRAIDSNAIPGLLQKIPVANSTKLRVTVDPQVPAYVECNIPALTILVDLVLRNCPEQTLSARVAVLGLDSPTMVCLFSAMDASQLTDAMLSELKGDMLSSRTTGVIDAIAAADAFLLFQPLDESGQGGHHTPTIPAVFLGDSLNRGTNSSRGGSVSPARSVSPSVAAVKGTPCNLAIFFPFRCFDPNNAKATWEIRGTREGTVTRQHMGSMATATPSVNITAPTPLSSVGRRSSMQDLFNQSRLLHNVTSGTTPGAGAASTSMQIGVLAPGAAMAAPNFSVMVIVESELDRTKLIRTLWEAHHSAFPVDKFFPRGAKLLRINPKQYDIVVLDVPQHVTARNSADQYEKDVMEIAKTFPEVVFIIRVERKRKGSASASSSEKAPEKQSSGLFSIFKPIAKEEKLKNFHTINKNSTPTGIADLLDFIGRQGMAMQEEIAKKQHLVRVFREHRTGPWTRGKKLGKGTFGDVYEADMPLTGGKMAVKVMRISQKSNGSDDDQQEQMNQLVNEIEILSTVQHPNIVQFFHCESSPEGKEVFVFMELCNGGSLQSKISLNPLPLSEISNTMMQVCSALQYLHKNHLAHRDIKPANLLLSDGKIKLADFGTATAVKAPLKDVAGTFAYMAPEVFSGEDYGTPCDIWSVGCVMLDLFGKTILTSIVGHNTGGLTGGYFSECTSDEEMWKRLDKIEDGDAQDFLKSCFRLDPLQRQTAEQLLRHPFIEVYQRSSSGGGKKLFHQSSGSKTSTSSSTGDEGGPQKNPSKRLGGRGPIDVEASIGALSIKSESAFDAAASPNSKRSSQSPSDGNRTPFQKSTSTHIPQIHDDDDNDEDDDDDDDDDGWLPASKLQLGSSIFNPQVVVSPPTRFDDMAIETNKWAPKHIAPSPKAGGAFTRHAMESPSAAMMKKKSYGVLRGGLGNDTAASAANFGGALPTPGGNNPVVGFSADAALRRNNSGGGMGNKRQSTVRVLDPPPPRPPSTGANATSRDTPTPITGSKFDPSHADLVVLGND